MRLSVANEQIEYIPSYKPKLKYEARCNEINSTTVGVTQSAYLDFTKKNMPIDWDVVSTSTLPFLCINHLYNM